MVIRMIIETVVFYVLATMVIALSLVVAFVQHPVRQILSLISIFVLVSILWLLLHAEFLALLLIFVYVGAVMTLFLYMVMMFNSDQISQGHQPYFWLYYIAYLTLSFLGLAVLWYLTGASPQGLNFFHTDGPIQSMSLKSMGIVLFDDYWLAFEGIGLLLLATMMGCIFMVFRGHHKVRKKQVVSEQILVTKSSRLRIIEE